MGKAEEKEQDQGPQKGCSRDWPSWGQVLSNFEPTQEDKAPWYQVEGWWPLEGKNMA